MLPYLYLITIPILMLILVFIGIKIGKKIGKKQLRNQIKKDLSKGTGRFGLLTYSKSYDAFYIEVEEISSAGSLTKVKLIEIFASKNSTYSNDELLKSAKFNEWVSTTDITWFNDNSQKMREEKLNSLLDK